MNDLLHYLKLIERPINIAIRTRRNDILNKNQNTILQWIDSALKKTTNKKLIDALKILRKDITGEVDLTKVIDTWKKVKSILLGKPEEIKRKEDQRIEVRETTANRIDMPVQYVKGVGPKRAKLLNKLNIETVRDLIYFFPRDYEDRSQLRRFDEIEEGENITAYGRIVDVDRKEVSGGRKVVSALVSDGHGIIEVLWWGMPYLYNKLGRGEMILISGKAGVFGGRIQITNPEFELGEDFDGINYGRIVPIYPLTRGIYQKNIRRIIHSAIKTYVQQVEEFLPEYVIEEESFMGIKEAIESIHFPATISDAREAKRRLTFNSLFLLQLGILHRKMKLLDKKGISMLCEDGLSIALQKTLPFKPTNSQLRAINEIKNDMMSERPMMRLLQGDVGSGKTLVATISALMTVESGYQVAIMAPTEILARQHHRNLNAQLSPLGVRVFLMVGGQSDNERSESVMSAREGEVGIYIGTHALIQEKVKFENLGLVIIDEQHRFGIHQRAELLSKSILPNLLVMTATPIPRTLALTIYGDLDLSVIDEMPPGRGKRTTIVVNESERERAEDIIVSNLKEGKQAFIVYPLIDESEKMDLKAATYAFKKIWLPKFTDFGVALLHGRMPKDEQHRIMADFENGRVKLLVTTTVAEVGIDVSNATVMVVECADRFGLSQLHQLRGRIGRGSDQSYCILMRRDNITEVAEARLKALEQTDDGFKIAEEDLRLRGPGEFLGARQSGIPDRVLVAIIEEPQLLKKAKNYAERYIKEDPYLKSNRGALIRRYIDEIFGEISDHIVS